MNVATPVINGQERPRVRTAVAGEGFRAGQLFDRCFRHKNDPTAATALPANDVCRNPRPGGEVVGSAPPAGRALGCVLHSGGVRTCTTAIVSAYTRAASQVLRLSRSTAAVPEREQRPSRRGTFCRSDSSVESVLFR